MPSGARGPGRDDQSLEDDAWLDDRLFDAPPEEFVSVRGAVAAGLRASGDEPAAARVRGLRRPTAALWAVNQLARRFPETVRRLVRAGERLGEAQLAGADPEALRAASREHRAAIEALIRRAGAILEEHAGRPASAATVDGIRQTLTAVATAGEAARGGFERGRLLTPLRPAGFGEVIAGWPEGALARTLPVRAGPTGSEGGAPTLPAPGPAATVAAETGESPGGRPRPARRERAQARRAEARRVAERLARSADALEAQAARAEESATRLEARAQEAGRRARAGRAEADEAKRRAIAERAKAGIAASKAGGLERPGGGPGGESGRLPDL